MDRRDWPISRYKLGHEPGEDLSQVTTAQQRLEMMWPLAKEAWLLSGRPIPGYRREDAPGQVLRPPPRE
jgi:hypothetical protein